MDSIVVPATNGPITAVVSDFKDASGNPTSPPGAPNWSAGGAPLASLTPNPADPNAATIVLNGQIGTIAIEARYGPFTAIGTITVVAGAATSAVMNLSA